MSNTLKEKVESIQKKNENLHKNKMKLKYSKEEILQLKNAPGSNEKKDLPGWFTIQACPHRSLSQETPAFKPKASYTPLCSPVKTEQPTRSQVRAMASPKYMTPAPSSSIIQVFHARPIRGQINDEAAHVHVQRQLNSMTLDLPRALGTPRSGNHFHQRRTQPWNITHPNVLLPPSPPPQEPARMSWPIPYLKNYGGRQTIAYMPPPCFYY